jgi:hypothetical protein
MKKWLVYILLYLIYFYASFLVILLVSRYSLWQTTLLSLPAATAFILINIFIDFSRKRNK